jgi:hypothetical protein
MECYGFMHDRDLLSVLEKRVREVERMAADCILEGDVYRLQRSVDLYRKTAKVPVNKRVVVWPVLSRRSSSYGWPGA